MNDVPYNPQARINEFKRLVAEGMSPDTAFVLVTIVASNGAPSALDGFAMEEIRDLIAEYAKYTGQESLLWAKNW